ncbi:DUF5709 domain-containing protein [Geodermatophilus sp. SYSU D00691]
MTIPGSGGADPEQASGLLQPTETLDAVAGVADVLDTGWSPPERPWAALDWGTTWREETAGEGLAGRLARELPDLRDGDPAGDGLGDTADTDGELLDDEVGSSRTGRLCWAWALAGAAEGQLHGRDVGIDGAGASAEEAAVHLVLDPEPDDPRWGPR